MKHVLIIGSGLSGLTCAVELAKKSIASTLVSPYPSERAQSVMAAGGINAAIGYDDSPQQHAADTFRCGGGIADKFAIDAMCENAPEIIRWLEEIGVVFSRDEKGAVALRAFGGQSKNRTVYAGSSTGKQIMTALIREARRYECTGLIKRFVGFRFHSALIDEGKCYGALLYSEKKCKMETVFADAVVVATGGQNVLFGKTTGSTQCDGYVAAKLYEQGALLKNLEFIQYHPTTIETPQKRMLISEAARGEGGRLFYLKDDKRIYFMEDIYGEKGNLMPRDIVSKCIYDVPTQVYLDISFLGKKKINDRLLEVSELCKKYIGLDVTKESIPVYPSVHFFMGGLAVDRQHQTSIENLYAVGECAAMYHGANRLGGNSLLSAIYSGQVAAKAIGALDNINEHPDFSENIAQANRQLSEKLASKSQFSAVYIRQEIAKLMNRCLGITRNDEKLTEGLQSVDYYLSINDKLVYDADVSPYISYSLRPMLLLAKAILSGAKERKESRGAHIREDYPETKEEYALSSIVEYKENKCFVSFIKEQ